MRHSTHGRHILSLLFSAVFLAGTNVYVKGLASPRTARAQSSGILLSPVFAWTQETWTEPDTKYLAVIAEFQKQVASGKKASFLANQYKTGAQTNASTGKPEEDAAVFRFGYAAYKASRLERNDKFLADADNAMNRVRSTNSYQFTRLHFLLDCRLNNFLGLKSVGLRLLKRDPTDYDVKYYFVQTLEPGKTAEDRWLALTYMAQLIRQTPSSPKVYALLGYIYDIANSENHDPRDGDRAVAAYQHYLNLAPPNDDFRSGATNHIQFLETRLHSQKRSEYPR